MFGLIGACLAMYQMAKPENKNKVKAARFKIKLATFITNLGQ